MARKFESGEQNVDSAENKLDKVKVEQNPEEKKSVGDRIKNFFEKHGNKEAADNKTEAKEDKKEAADNKAEAKEDKKEAADNKIEAKEDKKEATDNKTEAKEEKQEGADKPKDERQEFLDRLRAGVPSDIKYRPENNKEKKSDGGDNNEDQGYERTRGGDAYLRRFKEYDD